MNNANNGGGTGTIGTMGTGQNFFLVTESSQDIVNTGIPSQSNALEAVMQMRRASLEQ